MASPLSFLAVYVSMWAILVIFWWLKFRTFKDQNHGVSGLPYYIIYRTTKLNNWIGRISSFSPRLWRTFWNLGVVTGVGSMVYIFYELSKNLVNLFFRADQAVSVQPIVPLPGLTVSFETFPYLVLALSVVVATHELSHGIASLVDHIPLKSTGAFFAHVIMGGFVEPDEQKLIKAKEASKLRVFAAGSFTNAVLGIVCIFLLFNFPATIAPFYNVQAGGVAVGAVPDNLPAFASGVQVGDIVSSINGTAIADIADLRQYMSAIVPGDYLVLGTQRGQFVVQTEVDQNNSTRAVIGISGLTDYISYDPKVPFLSSDLPPILLRAEFWLSIVLVSVALINMLPMYPFDGDKFLETALNLLGIKKTKGIRTAANAAAYSVLLLNIALSLLRFGFLRY